MGKNQSVEVGFLFSLTRGRHGSRNFSSNLCSIRKSQLPMVAAGALGCNPSQIPSWRVCSCQLYHYQCIPHEPAQYPHRAINPLTPRSPRIILISVVETRLACRLVAASFRVENTPTRRQASLINRPSRSSLLGLQRCSTLFPSRSRLEEVAEAAARVGRCVDGWTPQYLSELSHLKTLSKVMFDVDDSEISFCCGSLD